MRKRIFVISITLFLSIWSIISCKNNTNQSNAIVEANFEVDSSMLSSIKLIDTTLDFSIQIPKDFIEIDTIFFNSLKSKLALNEYKSSNILAGYINPSDSSLMVVLDVSNIKDSTFQKLRNNFEEILNSNNLWEDVQFQRFSHNKFIIDQFVLQNEAVLNFKLICFKPSYNAEIPRIELIYIVNKFNYLQNIKSVEASIGSLVSNI